MKTTAFGLLLAIALAACATATPNPTSTTAPTATPAAPKVDLQTLSAELDTMFQKFTSQRLFNGSVWIAQNDQVILSKGYGFADRDKQIPNTPQTRFLIASITKQFTAMAIVILQEGGKLSVQDKICKYLADCPEAWQPVTIHQLLTHTSGIPDTTGSYTTKDLADPLALEQEIAAAKAQPSGSQPGEKFYYNNMGYILLGKIIEAASGQSYETFLQKNIFEPLQMSDTGYYHNQGDLAVGYSIGTIAADPMNMWGGFSAGALYSTVEDLSRWDQALTTGKLIPPKALDAIFTPYVAADLNGFDYGYGWMISTDEPRIILHEGATNGFRGIIRRDPQAKVTIILLSNQETSSPGVISDMVAAKLLPE